MADEKLSKADKQVVKDEADATARDAAKPKGAPKPAAMSADEEAARARAHSEGMPYKGPA